MTHSLSAMRTLSVLQFLACTAGIYVSYLTQGVVQESLSTESFGPASERFENMEVLSCVQGLGCLLVSWALLSFTSFHKHKAEYPPLTSYWTVGLTNTVGPSSGFASLRNINYSAQVIIKSCKLIPTMLMGVVLYGVHYRFSEWAVVSILCMGLTLFSLKSSPKAISKLSSPNLILGYTLCALNLICDGYTNTCQDNINKQYKRNSNLYMMFTTNFWLSVWSSIFFVVAEWLGMHSACSQFLYFFWNYPAFQFYILQFCFCGAVGQMFIFWMIKIHGSVVNVLVTTTRKFMSILLSVFWSGTPLLMQQWIGVAMVFLGILGNLYIKNTKSKKAVSHHATNGVNGIDAKKMN